MITDIFNHIGLSGKSQIIRQQQITGGAFRQGNIKLEGFAGADDRHHSCAGGSFNFCNSQRRNRYCVIANRGFIIIQRVTPIGQRPVTQAGGTAICANQAATVQSGGLPRQRLPAGLQRITQHFQWLGGNIHFDIKSKADTAARIQTVKHKYRLIGIGGQYGDIIGNIGAGHIAQIIQPRCQSQII